MIRRLIVCMAGAGLVAGGAPSLAGAAVDARVTGSFAMVAHVTVAVNVRGEHRGQTLHRQWRITPEDCSGSVCGRLVLARQRGSGIVQRLVLRRTGAGRYSATGVFYVGLRCLGRTYSRGSRAPFRITLTVAGSQAVEGIRFARRLAATYDNPYRTDATPCPLGPSHDAARYAGNASSPVPSPPNASFTTTSTPGSDQVQFTDTSAPGPGGASITGREWDFGDPASGSANASSSPDPVHQFSGPGSYRVSLTVTDANGLTATQVQLVTVTGPTSSVASTSEISATSRLTGRFAGWTTA